jgi:hypothetical protein
MLASLQSFGRSPVSINTWKIFCNIGASWTAHSLSILLGILSGPDDFDGLIFDSNFSSPSCFMIIGLILFYQSTQETYQKTGEMPTYPAYLKREINTFQKTIGLYR